MVVTAPDHSEYPFDVRQVCANLWAGFIDGAGKPFCVYASPDGRMPMLSSFAALEIGGFFRYLSTWFLSVMDRGRKQGLSGFFQRAQWQCWRFMASIHEAMFTAKAYGTPEVFGALVTPISQRLSSTVA